MLYENYVTNQNRFNPTHAAAPGRFGLEHQKPAERLGVDDVGDFGVPLSPTQLAMRRELLEQVDAAFAKEPTLSGVIDGRRIIKLGKRGLGRAGYFPSKKNATGALPSVSLPVESRPEAVYALELERNPDVKAFRTQAIELVLPGSNSSAFPDFLIVDTAGRLHLREVKADKRYLSLSATRRFERLAAILRPIGFSYAVVDATEMPTGMKLANLFCLHKQFDRIPHQEELDGFMMLDFRRGTYRELKARCREVGLNEAVVPYLLFIERLATDWDRWINEDSEVLK